MYWDQQFEDAREDRLTASREEINIAAKDLASRRALARMLREGSGYGHPRRGDAERTYCPSCVDKGHGDGGNGSHSEPPPPLAHNITEEVLIEIVKNMSWVIDRLGRIK